MIEELSNPKCQKKSYNTHLLTNLFYTETATKMGIFDMFDIKICLLVPADLLQKLEIIVKTGESIYQYVKKLLYTNSC